MPRRSTKTQLSTDLRGKLHERSGHCCEICGRWGNNAHHRKNRSQGGKDELSNLMLLCGSGTTGCHGYVTEHPAESRDNGWSMWRSEDPIDKPVKYRGQLCRLDNEGHVYVIAKGRKPNGLGLL